MLLQVLGTGCAKCQKLEANTKLAVEELQINAVIEKVEDIAQIMMFGVMSTPALAIDGKIAFSGKLMSVKEIKELLSSWE